MRLVTTKSIRKTFDASTGNEATKLVELICATMLVSAGLMDIDDPICASHEFYNKLGHRGCLDCTLVEKCTACKMCE